MYNFSTILRVYDVFFNANFSKVKHFEKRFYLPPCKACTICTMRG